MKFGFDWRPSSNGHVHVYSPRAGTDSPLWAKSFQKHKSSVNIGHLLQVLPFG